MSPAPSQVAVTPRCVFEPDSATDIGVLVLLSRLTQCPFAVRSGGHAAFQGASSEEDGITVSLSRLNQVTVARDRKTVKVGSGNVWGLVYSVLDKQGLTVPGGRDANVGVGGLSLGGGISYFAGSVGMTVDNIESYELVTASGIPITVTANGLYSDLYWALRGGGNNFGIVISYTYPAIERNDVWGGSRAYMADQWPAVISAYISGAKAEDEHFNQIISFARASDTLRIANAQIYYSLPEPGDVVEPYLAIPNNLSDTYGTKTVSELAIELSQDSPNGDRQIWHIQAAQIDEELFTSLVDIFDSEVDAVYDQVNAFAPAMVCQHIDRNILSHMKKNGGNPLGIADSPPLMLYFFSGRWDDAADDQVVYDLTKRVAAKWKAETQKHGLASDYLYLNYASRFQDPISSYGASNKARLVKIAKQYDPTGVFQELMPGGFKLNGTPNDLLE
ncbi:hypothetical protein OHC33_004141 [Knufia fluminis]|uniref:FAD-binding PCMH-type domain-containing protein n=1 Tax=Knufia fluminis TaxID=191047 RepID=A0AAN8EFD9_9EURO|nr:hypothetical protein OHC33_004141 [Knufia fluminis]